MLKPMNCPAHVQIFNSNMVSYRDLPIRLAEFGCCHRNEPAGSLHGIMRLRQFVQDDAHIFCREDQIQNEVEAFCRLLKEVYEEFGFQDISVAISLRPANRSGSNELWDRAEAELIRAVEAVGLEYVLQPGDGAFYGPKLEYALKDSMERIWQCGTLQLDFVLPGKLDAYYVNEQGKQIQPVMIHRAILGSMERFIGILLEHYEGRLPDWLAPVQDVIIPISSEQYQYAEIVVESLRANGRRAVMDLKEASLMSKVRKYSEQFIPRIIVVGAKEELAQQASVRRLGSSQPEVVELAKL